MTRNFNLPFKNMTFPNTNVIFVIVCGKRGISSHSNLEFCRYGNMIFPLIDSTLWNFLLKTWYFFFSIQNCEFPIEKHDLFHRFYIFNSLKKTSNPSYRFENAIFLSKTWYLFSLIRQFEFFVETMIFSLIDSIFWTSLRKHWISSHSFDI